MMQCQEGAKLALSNRCCHKASCTKVAWCTLPHVLIEQVFALPFLVRCCILLVIVHVLIAAVCLRAVIYDLVAILHDIDRVLLVSVCATVLWL